MHSDKQSTFYQPEHCLRNAQQAIFGYYNNHTHVINHGSNHYDIATLKLGVPSKPKK